MKPTTFLLSLTAFAQFAIAQNAPLSPAALTPDRLARALKMFPDADLNKDGNLTLDEAVRYLESHPELRAMIAARLPERSTQNVAPGTRSTPADAGLPPGPRVFVCAHSFMNFTATQLPPLTRAAGLAWCDAGSQMIGGSQVIQHWNVPDEQNLAKQQLRAGEVDVLMLSPTVLLPDPGIENFAKLGVEKNPRLRVLVQASWPARDGEGIGFSNASRDAATVESLENMRERYEVAWLRQLEAQVNALNQELATKPLRIVPVSRAVFALRERVAQGSAPGIAKQSDLFRDDLGHPKPPLAALVSYCHFAAIHQRSPVGLPVPSDLKASPRAAELNTLLQQLAWEAVTHYPLSGVTDEAGSR